ncbi:MAG: SPFH domain-containing protein [Pirellulaceae bacterium]|nr:SPFH domain-containing protein [Pirellulaceae bacterium]
MTIISAFLAGMFFYVFIRVILSGFYIVRPNERAVLTSFGRAARLPNNPPASPELSEDEHERYNYPAVHVIRPGGPYFKWPWQKIHKVNVSTQAVELVWDPSKSQTTIEAVTKDNLTTGVNGQIRFRVSESNLYAYLFGVASPLEHVMGYFISILRERIAVDVAVVPSRQLCRVISIVGRLAITCARSNRNIRSRGLMPDDSTGMK